jgi:hypothetical protein
MYYAEKWEGGLLYYKTTPNGDWKLKTPTLADLADGVEQEKINLNLALNLAYTLGAESKTMIQ